MSSERFSSAQFIGEDFDGTIAYTSMPPKGGYNVESATTIAVGELFGPAAIERFKQRGGLQNRAPVEVVQQFAPDAARDETQALTDKFVAAKLEILTSQISSTWPYPVPGFVEFTTALRMAQEHRDINDIIISSGHEDFIRKTYEKSFGIEPPKLILAQEAIQRIAQDNDETMPVKPSPQLMLYAYNAWRNQYNLDPQASIELHDSTRMRYVGDDSTKDGVMAKRSNVAFHLISSNSPEAVWQQLALRLEVERKSA